MLALGLLWRALVSAGDADTAPRREGQSGRAAMEPEQERALEVYDLIRTIRDPEKPNTLEELEVVSESCVEVAETGPGECLVTIRFTPTVPHCSLATLIAGSLRIGGAHSTEEDINKQINDKERVAAAMENPSLREIVDQCLLEPD